jgi:cell division protein FtsI (penicillin-binding protein 3)
MEKATRNRLALLTLVVLATAAGIGTRLWQLQVRGGEAYRAQALGQHQRVVSVPATRGSIVDRNLRELAVSVETESLFAHPRRVENPEQAAALLAPVIGLSKGKILDRFRTESPFVYLRRFLSPEAAQAVRELELPVGPAHPFGFLRESKRQYPRGALAGHIVGFANIDGQGVEGIEQRFEAHLRGDPTVFLVEHDARNGRLWQPIRLPERQPHDVILTVDLVLQHIAERELDRALAETGARAASAIVIDPSTGQILALANRPTADLRDYGRATDAERINRALVHIYEPGSTFKVVPMATALEQGVVRPGQRFFCENGTYRLGSRRIRDVSRNGTLSLRQVIARSSNIGMVKITRELPPLALHDSIRRFGFGSRTGVELPGESAGILKPVPRWSSYTQASLSFGQEIGTTVLQMTSAMATVASGGIRIAPRVVLGLRDVDGRVRHFAPPEPERVISEQTARELRSMLEGVITDGSGGRAAVPGYRVAGKSGTAQKAVPGGYSETEFMASFGGFAPAGAPRLVALVVLDSPRGHWNEGGRVAAPVFARILEDSLRYLRVPQDEDLLRVRRPAATTREAVPASRSRIAAAITPGRVPSLAGLSSREAIARLAAHGYRAEVEGSGSVVAQHPEAGTRLAAGETCHLRLAREIRRESLR